MLLITMQLMKPISAICCHACNSFRTQMLQILAQKKKASQSSKHPQHTSRVTRHEESMRWHHRFHSHELPTKTLDQFRSQLPDLPVGDIEVKLDVIKGDLEAVAQPIGLGGPGHQHLVAGDGRGGLCQGLPSHRRRSSSGQVAQDGRGGSSMAGWA